MTIRTCTKSLRFLASVDLVRLSSCCDVLVLVSFIVTGFHDYKDCSYRDVALSHHFDLHVGRATDLGRIQTPTAAYCAQDFVSVSDLAAGPPARM